ncbi:ubiquitin carboxyl-terminal hydrolase 37-like [Clarias gariepinus]|uniref:ubiquitin carboxyl-terminal hydrolase 37-like n=1 Tax=Clarias gariepinus TaxID=13013 RepID=UPI00234CE5DA|nr:ubiquitin carboxyl-terminal hydrolase 37-like [Clarias gariepinus]
MMVQRNNTTLKDQVKKTTEWRVTSTNRLNVKTVKRKPKKIIPVILEWKKMMLYVQEKKKKTAAWKQLMQSSEQNKTERHSKEVSSYMRYRKRSTDSNSFSFKKKMRQQSKRSISLPYNLSLLTKMQLFNGGLPNVGNSCYVNAGLQFLFTAEAFCEELSHLLDSSFQNNVNFFLRYFVNLSKLRKTSKVQGVIGKDSLLLGLIALSVDINPEFTIGQQSDAHEFLCHCLTQIEEFGRCLGWKEDSEPKCPVRSNFKFMMRNIIKCSSCGYQQKNKLEEFNHISLPLEHNSVDQCLHDTKSTFVESKCEFCGGKSASSSLTFDTLPRFLILQLNRFKMSEDYTVVKQQISMDIQSQLHINCFAQSDATRIEDIKAEARHTERNNLGGSVTTYQLISVLSHVGSSTFCGHYVSDCSSPSVNPLEWMTYDDNLVTLTTEAKVLKRRSCSAYMLLYEKVHTIKENTTFFTF